VEGAGFTAHEARQDAFLRAAEKAVGAYVFAETSLSEEEIREEIVNLSAGIVEDYELLRTGQLSDGSYSVKILAHVNTQPLTSKLMSETKVSHGEIQGGELVKAALTRKHSRERFVTQSRKALTEVLKGFPEDYLVLKESGSFAITDTTSDSKGLVETSYTLIYDKERYEESFLPALERLLVDIGEEVDLIFGDAPDSVITDVFVKLPMELLLGVLGGGDYVVFGERTSANRLRVNLSSEYSDFGKPDQKHRIIVVQEPKGLWDHGFEFKVLRIDSETAKSIQAAWVRSGQIKARLSGRADSGKLLFQSDVPLALGKHVFLSPLGGGTLISPLLASGTSSNLIVEWTYEVPIHFKFPVPYQVLEEVTELEAEVVR